MWYIWGFFGRFEIARVVFLIQLLVADFLIWYELTTQGGEQLASVVETFGQSWWMFCGDCLFLQEICGFPVRISMVKGNCDVWPIPIIPRTNVVLKIG